MKMSDEEEYDKINYAYHKTMLTHLETEATFKTNLDVFDHDFIYITNIQYPTIHSILSLIDYAIKHDHNKAIDNLLDFLDIPSDIDRSQRITFFKLFRGRKDE